VQAHAATGGEAQEWARAMLGTVGRGGNAQARPAHLIGRRCRAACLGKFRLQRMHGGPTAPVQLALH